MLEVLDYQQLFVYLLFLTVVLQTEPDYISLPAYQIAYHDTPILTTVTVFVNC